MKSQIHKSQFTFFRNQKGFTLIGAIATIMLAGVLIALLLPLLGTGATGSRKALISMPETHNLRTEMDTIWHQYRMMDPIDLPDLADSITDAAGTSPPPPYTLDLLGWVEFDSNGVEYTPGSGNGSVLKVTLGNSKGEQLTSYFFPAP